MHFSCLTVGDPYEQMGKYCLDYGIYEYDETLDMYTDRDGNSMPEALIICDYFMVGGRMDHYIGVRDLNEIEPFPSLAVLEKDKDDYLEFRQKCVGRSSAHKKNICGFYSGPNSWTKKYPDTFAYIDAEGELHKIPEEREFYKERRVNNTLDKEAFKKAMTKWRREYLKWYKSIPEDEVISIVDFHI